MKEYKNEIITEESAKGKAERSKGGRSRRESPVKG